LALVHFGKNSEPKVISASFSWFQPRKKPATSWHPDQFLSNGVKNQSGNLGNAWGRFKHRNAGFFRRQFLDVGRLGEKVAIQLFLHILTMFNVWDAQSEN
jgi:hypothetical protein